MGNSEHKAGFVNIIGLPNAGKSTLLNALMGEKMAIITPKPQTTRHRIIGILNEENYQIVFSDTPGIVKPHNKLHEKMMSFVRGSLQDADIFIYLVDFFKQEIDEEIIEKIKELKRPLFIAINKIDKADATEVEQYKNKLISDFPCAFVETISAKDEIGTAELIEKIVELLPHHAAFYPKDDSLSDRSMRFFVSEIIREKIFLNYRDEIPYATEVFIENYVEKEDIVVINAVIFVERETQKAILIGNNGKAIKKVGIESRKDIEEFIGSKVFLELVVKVSKNWRQDDQQLDRFGYKLS
ncbi:MAG: GTPase Era [Bacteroidales bacterium]|jgi:GTP-binding protein Era